MPTTKAIAMLFSTLEAAGFTPPRQIAGKPEDLAMAIKVWTHALDSLADEEVMIAASMYIKESGSSFWPVPGVLLAYLDTSPDPGATFTALMRYWTRLSTDCPEMTPQTTEALEAIGGRYVLESIQNKDIPFLRGAFVKAYNGAKRKASVERARVECAKMRQIEGGG